MHSNHAVAQWAKQEQGASLVYMALMLPFMISLAALMIDGSNLYREQFQIQTATDAAALAGARLLALGGSTTQVQSEVETLATTNGADSVTWSYLTNNTGIQVTAAHTFATFFAGILGHSTVTVRATASAHYGGATSADNLLPIALMCDDMANDPDEAFTFGVEYTLWNGNMKSPGNFGWLDWNGVPVGNNELADNIAHPGNSGAWDVGDWIPAGPGIQNSAPVRNALDTWLNKTVTIPLYSTVTGNGANTKYQICSFAEFTLTGYNFSGSDKWVKGKFIQSLKHSRSGTATHDFGLRDVQIVH